ncbi:transmembrane protease serine 9-like [Bicyclus anynana]|uniref:Transmembrane protease serine 9-like n=1 Tax=Bicyclus anynana TaxID=110368 RepID=A0ABM3LWW7_BICAN|nr:transmembrane protease serine 9-like [Bicyclus anynana]
MKVFLVVACLALAVSAEFEYESIIMKDYHEEFGIPQAARIKAAEDALDFDGSRIAGGTASGLGAHPHLGGLVVTLTDNRQSVCGSSLLTNYRLVTAAHCWQHGNSRGRHFTVVLGSVRLFQGGHRVNTNNVQMHASYNQNTLANDIAIIAIPRVGYTNHIRNINLASGNNQFAGSWANVAGFGRTGDGAQHGISNNQILAHLDVQVITNNVCAQTFRGIPASVLCVGTSNGRSPCPGDSGGPLTVGSGTGRQLIGIVSFGHVDGCQRNFPAAFQRMKLLLVVASLALAVSAEYGPLMKDYHEEFGVPQAARIKAFEAGLDFDGSRIAGGSASALGAHPHMGGLIVTLTDNRQSVCGSSLLTNYRLLTAAHCWQHGTSRGRQLTVVLASIRLFHGGHRVNTNNVQMHASYNQNTLANDIAIIAISRVGYTNHIRNIGLASGNNQFVGAWANVAGFGRTGDAAQHAITNNQILAELNLQVIGNDACRRVYGNSILASTICTATPGGRGPCPGDSGGPLTVGSGTGRQLIGVVSFVHRDGCTRSQPAGYARVTSFHSWISQRI